MEMSQFYAERMGDRPGSVGGALVIYSGFAIGKNAANGMYERKL